MSHTFESTTCVLAREFCRGQPLLIIPIRAHHNLFPRQRPEERRPKQPIQGAVPLSKTPWPWRPYCRPYHHPTQNVALRIVYSGPERKIFSRLIPWTVLRSSFFPLGFLYRGGWGMHPPLYSSLHFHHHHLVPPLIETLEGSRPASIPPHPPPRICILGVQASECPYPFQHSLSLFRSSRGEKPTSLRTLPTRLPRHHRWVLRLLGFSIPPPLTAPPGSSLRSVRSPQV